jgi:hypothetical protein
MLNANKLVDLLLENESDEEVKPSTGEEVEPADKKEIGPPTRNEIRHNIKLMLKGLRGEDLTRENAETVNDFWSRTETYSDGVTPIWVRRNGRTKTWVTRPKEFRIPVKYGFYEHFYITDKDAANWSVTPLLPKMKPGKKKKIR